MRRSIFLITLLCGAALTVASSVADELDSAIQAWNSSRVCPKGGKYDFLTYDVYCKKYCDLIATCNSDRVDRNPCNSAGPGCEAFKQGSDQCRATLLDVNARRRTYNEIVSQCRRGVKKTDRPPEAKPAATDHDELDRALEEQRAKAEGADARNAENEAKVKSAGADAKICDDMIAKCRDTAKNPECERYCNHLQAESCKKGSWTLKRTYELCRAADRLRWAAFAYSPSTNDWGYWYNALNAAEAEKQALSHCGRTDCTLASSAWTGDCRALASCSNSNHGFWLGRGTNHNEAANDALRLCNGHASPRCYVRHTMCPYGRS